MNSGRLLDYWTGLFFTFCYFYKFTLDEVFTKIVSDHFGCGGCGSCREGYGRYSGGIMGGPWEQTRRTWSNSAAADPWFTLKLIDVMFVIFLVDVNK